MISANNKTLILIPIMVILISMLSIQSGATLAKSLFPVVGPQGVTALRLGIGTILLIIVLRPWRHKSGQPITPRVVLSLIGYGLSLGIMNLLFYMSLSTVPLGIAVAFEFTGPLAVAMFASRRPIDFLWIILAMFGLYFLLPINQSISNVDPVGACYALGAGACWALYIIFGKRAGATFGTQAVALGAIIASLVIIPVGVYHSGLTLFSWSILPIALAVAVLSTALPYSLEMIALTRLPTKTFGTLMSLEPAVGALCGLVFLNEMLTFSQWLALLAIILASIGASMTIKPPSRIRSVSE